MWGAGGTWRATMSRAHTGDARRATQGLPCSAPAVCSWQQLHPPARQRAASPSPPAGVSGQQRGHPSAWPASVGWHISGDHHLQTHPLHPTRTTSCPCSRGKFSPALQDTLRASLPENRVPSLPLHLLRLSRALAEPYRVPGVLDDSCFLRQDLDELLGLPLTEHHAADRGHECLVGQVQGPIRICRC